MILVPQWRRNAWSRLGGASLLVILVLVLAQLGIGKTAGVTAGVTTPRSVQLGYFYNPPADGTTVQTLAQKTGLLILHEGTESYRDQLRQAGFQGPALQYYLALQVLGPARYTDSSQTCTTPSGWMPLHNEVADQPDDFCSLVHPHEDWFLHNSQGKRLYSVMGQSYAYYMNPASSGWQNFARQRMADDLQNLGYNGIYLDNVDLSRYRLTNSLADSDGTVKEFGTDDAYRGAVAGYLNMLSGALRVNDQQIWANFTADPRNGTAWNSYLPYVDGVVYEPFATGWASSSISVQDWNSHLTSVDSAVAQGKGLLLISQGSKDDTVRETFALASYLLVAGGSSSYFRYSNAQDYREFWDYGNYGVQLGSATGARYKSGTSWRRDFQCGYVTVNPSAHTGQIVTQTCASTSPSPPPSPIRVEAENFKSGGEGVAFHDTTPANRGGAYRNTAVDIEPCSDSTSASPCYDVGYIAAGEWLAYTLNVPASGSYSFTLRVASPNSGETVGITIDGVSVGTLSVPNTGGWQTWTSVTSGTVNLTAGTHELRLTTSTGGFNVNYLVMTAR